MPHNADNRRQDFRVEDMLPWNDAPISLEEFEMRKKHVGIRSRQSSMLRDMVGTDLFAGDSRNKLNSDVAQAMEALDAKLNYLIGINTLNDANRSDLNERAINLSVTGASFVSEQIYQQGEPVFMTMMLPSFPPLVLELLGEVMWVRENQHGRPLIGVKFFYRCDEEEDSIAKYVFRRHREMIRIKKQKKHKSKDNLA